MKKIKIIQKIAFLINIILIICYSFQCNFQFKLIVPICILKILDFFLSMVIWSISNTISDQRTGHNQHNRTFVHMYVYTVAYVKFKFHNARSIVFILNEKISLHHFKPSQYEDSSDIIYLLQNRRIEMFCCCECRFPLD